MYRAPLRAACLVAVLLFNLLLAARSPEAATRGGMIVRKSGSAESSAIEPHAAKAFVRRLVNGQIVCQELTGEEARAFARRDPRLPLREIVTEDVSVQQTGLNIVLRSTPQLDNFPQAKEAFLRAAAQWEELITTPITVIIDVDFGPTLFGEPFDEDVIGGTSPQSLFSPSIYPAVRNALVASASDAEETALYAALPAATVPTDIGNTAGVIAPSAALRALGLIAAVADPAAEPESFGDPPAMGFNSNFDFDFDPGNGIDPDKVDFDATAVHEIGHVLGFISSVGDKEMDPSEPTLVSLWDIFRFRPGVGLGTFTNANRVLSSGGEQRFFDGAFDVSLSTGRQDGTGGDQQQASHWKDDGITGQYLGIMDPTATFGERQTLTNNDAAVLDAIGYSVGNAPPPVDTAVPLVSGEPQTGGIPDPPAPGLGFLSRTQYTIEVPPGAMQLKVDLTGNQDVDLFVRFGDPISLNGTHALADYMSVSETGTESITITPSSSLPLRAGTYFIAVANFGPGAADYALTATVTPGSGGGGGATSGPVLNQLGASLNGNNLALIIVGGDADGDVTMAELSLLNEANQVVNQPAPAQVSFGNQTQINTQMIFTQMGSFPTAFKARLVLIDATGNRSNAVTADFSQAQPGGATISSASFNGSKMTLKVRNISGTLELEVNGQIIPRKIKSNSSGSKLTIKGNAAQMNIRTGPNRIRIKSNSLWSNIRVIDND